MAEQAQELSVENTGQPLVAQISPATESNVSLVMTPQIAANVTVLITPVSG